MGGLNSLSILRDLTDVRSKIQEKQACAVKLNEVAILSPSLMYSFRYYVYLFSSGVVSDEGPPLRAMIETAQESSLKQS